MKKKIFTREELQNEFHRKFILNFFQFLCRRRSGGMEIKLKDRYIPPFIMLLAGAVTSIINIVNKVVLVTGLKRLLLVIIIFYFIGLIVKTVIRVALTKFAKKEVPEENQEENKQPEGKKS